MCIDDIEGFLATSSETGVNIYVQGPFKHVFYRVGDNAVPSADSDGDGVPDHVADIALQYLVAYHIFMDIVGFRSPFLNPKHAGMNYQYIRVTHTAANGSASFSYRVVQTDTDGIGYTPIAHSIASEATGGTPIHELFHQVQYGYTWAGNSWYLEGMARWSENALFNQPYVVKSREELLSILRVPTKWEALSNLSYAASEHFWRPFGHCFGSETQTILNPNDPILQLKYHDGTKIVREWDYTGMRLLPLFFKNLEDEMDRCLLEQGYDGWSTNVQKAEVNNKYIRWAAEEMLTRM
jgi:hypothetical protein